MGLGASIIGTDLEQWPGQERARRVLHQTGPELPLREPPQEQRQKDRVPFPGRLRELRRDPVPLQELRHLQRERLQGLLQQEHRQPGQRRGRQRESEL